MAWVKLSRGWINLDHLGAADDDSTSISLHSELKRGSRRLSLLLTGDDAQTMRGALDALSANVATSENVVEQSEA